MKTDFVAKIVAKREVAPRHFWMRLTCPWEPDEPQPGQFVHLWLPEIEDPLLRRPYTIYRVRDGHVEILFQVVGQGSGLLAEQRIGDAVRLLGPLGTGFRLPPADATALVVGGGAGMASLFLLIERLRDAGIATRVLIGARSREYVLCRAEIEALGAPVSVSTDDGSEGVPGLVPALTAYVLDRERPPNPHVYACGPTPMMEALSKITLATDVPTQVALENRMGCALGVCLGCVVPIRRPRGKTYQRVCTEGPVFDARDVIWEFRL